MIVREQVEINGKSFVKQCSDKGFYIERDGEKYSEVQDPEEFGREYTETNDPIDVDPSDELTISDALEALSEMGVNTND